ncbi:MAG: hypothetical protein ACI8Y4_004019 [Candidatus Poriferisodalaceae bacterium]|jgi:hypothetical protein
MTESVITHDTPMLLSPVLSMTAAFVQLAGVPLPIDFCTTSLTGSYMRVPICGPVRGARLRAVDSDSEGFADLAHAHIGQSTNSFREHGDIDGFDRVEVYGGCDRDRVDVWVELDLAR